MKRRVVLTGALLVLFGCSEMPVEIPDARDAADNAVAAGGESSQNSDFDLGGSTGFLGADGLSTRSDDLIGINSDITLGLSQLNTDFVVGGLGGTRNIGAGPITISGISGMVTRALLYWHGPTNTASTNVTVKVDGIEVSERSLGFSSDNCWGFSNSQAWAADVTAIVQAKGNGSYAITGLTGPSVNSNGASLIVYFNDGNASNNRDVVVFEGNDSNINNSYDAPGWNVSLPGINYSGGTANMQMHVADGQTFQDAAITINNQPFLPAGGIFNGNTVPQVSNGPGNNGSLWDIRSFNVTSFLTLGVNTLTLRTGVFSDCLALVVALVDLPAGAAPPDIPVENKPPVANAGADQTVNLSGAPTTSVTLDGTGSTDDGKSAPLTYTWKIGATTVATGATPTITLGLGTHTITLTVFDGAFSSSDNVVITVKDPTAPNIVFAGSLSYTVDQTVSITCTATDAESGIASTSCPAVASGPAYGFALGNNTGSATATNGAGLVTTSAVVFTVNVTYDSLCNLVKLWVTHAGVANSLCVKLKNAEASAARGSINSQHGQLGAFVNEVQAQDDKKVPADKAPILTALAEALKL